MNDRTTGAPNTRPGAAGPKSPIRCWADDTAGRDALNEIQRCLDQTWDVEAGLQEILLAERYNKTIEAQARTSDVEKRLAEIVGPPSDRSDPWVSGANLPAEDDAGLILGDGRTGVVNVLTSDVNEAYRVRIAPRSFGLLSTLDQIEILALSMLEVLQEIRQVDGLALVKHVTYADSMSVGIRSAEELQSLADSLEERLVTRDQAVDVVDRAGSVCQTIHNILKNRALDGPHLPLNLRPAVARLRRLSRDIADLRVAVARLFDPSDDLVDVLL
ncbi:hypothetical protein OG992_33185 [Micromonospora sp. NBC_00362]|uniref:hypothetical protein n=1 Tax=Micromonospora sp. NBC_00362 TaxID=2975975 RepID=UPI0022549904|nr:hypothetical protein [Micromonospora sp. NBC_00362]MCX5122019.1 hypothetical protein [Micromonospora sp. NBC_00362]